VLESRKMSRSRNLVFSSVGSRNNVRSWLSAPAEKEFDLAIYYFGDEDDPGLTADFFVRRKDLKFANFYHFINAGGLQGYDAVWVVDDDIILDTKSINQMFRVFSDYRLLMAQPSFDRQCRRPWGITFTDPDFILRYTNFVENGVVVLATGIIDQIKNTFRDAGTGFGVDFIWPSILGFPRDRIAVIDSVSCTHPNGQHSSLNEVVPRSQHLIQGTELLIKYDLLPEETDISNGKFVKPYNVEEFGGIKQPCTDS